MIQELTISRDQNSRSIIIICKQFREWKQGKDGGAKGFYNNNVFAFPILTAITLTIVCVCMCVCVCVFVCVCVVCTYI